MSGIAGVRAVHTACWWGRTRQSQRSQWLTGWGPGGWLPPPAASSSSSSRALQAGSPCALRPPSLPCRAALRCAGAPGGGAADSRTPLYCGAQPHQPQGVYHPTKRWVGGGRFIIRCNLPPIFQPNSETALAYSHFLLFAERCCLVVLQFFPPRRGGLQCL